MKNLVHRIVAREMLCWVKKQLKNSKLQVGFLKLIFHEIKIQYNIEKILFLIADHY